MKLYGALASPYVTRVVMLARIKGIDLELAELPGGSPRSPEYVAFNPIAKIPSLEVDGHCLPESEVICEYLEEVGGGAPGLPVDPLERATARLVSRIVDLYVAPCTSDFFRQMNPATRDQAAVDAATAELNKGLGFLEHFMGNGPFAVGDVPTIGDCAAAPYLMLIRKIVFANFSEIADPTKGDGRLGTWWTAIMSDDACRNTVEEYGKAVDGFMQAMAARITAQA